MCTIITSETLVATINPLHFTKTSNEIVDYSTLSHELSLLILVKVKNLKHLAYLCGDYNIDWSRGNQPTVTLNRQLLDLHSCMKCVYVELIQMYALKQWYVI